MKKIDISICRVLPSDYQDYGGNIVRWLRDDQVYADCSSCKHFAALQDEPYDYGVCMNKKSPRCGLLTFEHQAGYECCEEDENDEEDT